MKLTKSQLKEMIREELLNEANPETEIYKKFTQDKDFQRRYKEFVFDTLVESSNQTSINP